MEDWLTKTRKRFRMKNEQWPKLWFLFLLAMVSTGGALVWPRLQQSAKLSTKTLVILPCISHDTTQFVLGGNLKSHCKKSERIPLKQPSTIWIEQGFLTCSQLSLLKSSALQQTKKESRWMKSPFSLVTKSHKKHKKTQHFPTFQTWVFLCGASWSQQCMSLFAKIITWRSVWWKTHQST